MVRNNASGMMPEAACKRVYARRGPSIDLEDLEPFHGKGGLSPLRSTLEHTEVQQLQELVHGPAEPLPDADDMDVDEADVAAQWRPPLVVAYSAGTHHTRNHQVAHRVPRAS